LRLRRGRREDLPALARLYRETVRASLPFLAERRTAEEDLRHLSDDLFPKAQFWLLEDVSGEPAGYIAFQPDFIDHLFLRPEHQGQGLGARLLARAKAEAAELSLWTFQRNLAARRFYERHGFVAALETDGADNEEGEPDVFYLWRRDPAP
jgi:GNAT superfamily N-acetyltransferase